MAQAVKIDLYTTLYNANKTGKGSPRLRVRISKIPTTVVSRYMPDTGKPRVYKNGGFSVPNKNANAKAVRAMVSKLRFLNSTGVGAALTFAPTAALDLVDTVDRDVNGNLHWNYRQFMINEAKGQSGNLVGWGTTATVGIIAVAIAGSAAAATAPVILIGLGLGILAQVVWNYTGCGDWVGAKVERIARE